MTVRPAAEEETVLPAAVPGTPASAVLDGNTGPRMPARYQRLGWLGCGGFGEVHLVLDRSLQRELALKVLRPDLVPSQRTADRFLEEAQIAARLEHPGIVPIYDLGWLDNGAMYYTMKRVEGRTLREDALAFHASSGTNAPAAVGLHLLVGHLHRVCEAVAFAHSRGVVHRDLKPSNVMIGAFGEVLVVDWGLARAMGTVVGAAEDGFGQRAEAGPAGGPLLTAGSMLGTPGYAAPELVAGLPIAALPAADVYSLGAILHVLLTGKPVLPMGPTPNAPPMPDGSATPPELWRICLRALAPDPKARHPDAAGLASELRDWLQGAHRRREAEALVAQAQAELAQAERMRDLAHTKRIAGAALLAGVHSYDPIERKRPGWQAQDEAEQLANEVLRADLRGLQLLTSALQLAPDLTSARHGVADYHQRQHARAEASRDRRAADAAEQLVRLHDDGRHAAYLDGSGVLTLHTTPKGAEAVLCRYETLDRRLHAVRVRSLGTTPLDAVPLPMGRWLVELRAPDRAVVHYPVHIGRQDDWHGRPPNARVPCPIALPRKAALGPEDCYVPAGWFLAGDDMPGVKCLKPQRVWLDGFVMQRNPVTNAQYAAFLNDLCATGREAQALQHAPRERKGGNELGGAVIYGRDGDGRFFPTYDADGDLWLPDTPVTMVTWHGAQAYARWLAERTQLPWRLPYELEWEKAARGVDGRAWPWGDFLDPTWAAIHGSRAGHNAPSLVTEFPIDASPYGVRGLAGNSRDWCQDAFTLAGLDLDGKAFVPGDGSESAEAPRVLKGGSFFSPPDASRASARQDNLQLTRTADTGIRLVRGMVD